MEAKGAAGKGHCGTAGHSSQDSRILGEIKNSNIPRPFPPAIVHCATTKCVFIPSLFISAFPTWSLVCFRQSRERVK